MTRLVQTLLLVEDFAPDRELYRRCLLSDSEVAYAVLEAESVMAGLALCRESAIDAILLDYTLPDGNGIEFLQALRAQNNGSNPPVVMVSGAGNERLAVQAIKLGAEDYLVKQDLTPELLQVTLRTAIENARLRLQLRQSDDRFRVSIENMLDCFGIYSAIRDKFGQIIDFRFDYLNAAALASNEMTWADMSKTLCEIFPAHRETALFADYCRVVERGEPLVKENLIYCDTFGTQSLTRAYDVRASKLGDGLVISWRDVTERKQSELALQEANQQITEIWESMTDAYVTLDREWRVVYANSAATHVYRQLTRLEPEEFLGKSHWEIFPALVGSSVEQAYRQAVAEQVAVHFEVFYEPTGGWFEAHAYPSTAGLGIYFRDISDRKEAELERSRLLAEAEAAREEAEAANRSKDEFIAIVAHELRSPLNSIAGWSKLLQSRKFDEATLSKALDTIWRNTQAQVQLVEDLLDISRLVRGTLQINFAPVNWVEVLEAALEVVQPMANVRQIQLETHFTLVPHISGDFNRLQQIAINLLTNAIKFTPEGGRVNLDLEQIDAEVVVRVRDTGKGIASEFLPLIFERFQQGQQNTGSKDGLGLGMAIVKNLVELHHGIITVESAGIGAGATFTLRFPRLATPAMKRVALIVEATSLAGIRVLAVDDDPDMLNLIAFVLQDYGAEVQAVSTLTAALECLSQFRPDVLVSDLAMPGGNGYELVQQMRSYPEGQIPAIALTAYASETHRERSRLTGFQHHLTKPMNPKDLVAAILSLIQGRTA